MAGFVLCFPLCQIWSTQDGPPHGKRSHIHLQAFETCNQSSYLMCGGHWGPLLWYPKHTQLHILFVVCLWWSREKEREYGFCIHAFYFPLSVCSSSFHVEFFKVETGNFSRDTSAVWMIGHFLASWNSIQCPRDCISGSGVSFSFSFSLFILFQLWPGWDWESEFQRLGSGDREMRSWDTKCVLWAAGTWEGSCEGRKLFNGSNSELLYAELNFVCVCVCVCCCLSPVRWQATRCTLLLSLFSSSS